MDIILLRSAFNDLLTSLPGTAPAVHMLPISTIAAFIFRIVGPVFSVLVVAFLRRLISVSDAIAVSYLHSLTRAEMAVGDTFAVRDVVPQDRLTIPAEVGVAAALVRYFETGLALFDGYAAAAGWAAFCSFEDEGFGLGDCEAGLVFSTGLAAVPFYAASVAVVGVAFRADDTGLRVSLWM